MQNTVEGGIINIESESITNEGKAGTEGVPLRRGGERIDGAYSKGQISSVEGGTGQNQEWRENRSRPAESEATRLLDEGRGREVRVADLGILNGSKQQKVRVIENEADYTPSMKRAAANAKKQGLNVKFFVGDNILIEEKNGSITGVNGYILGNQVLVRADHNRFTSEQIFGHEAAHDRLAKAGAEQKSRIIATARQKLADVGDKVAYEALAEFYEDAYSDSNLTDEELWEEIVCDIEGGMNWFADERGELMQLAIQDVKGVVESATVKTTEGVPEGKASRATEESNTDNEKESELYETREETRDEFNRAAHEANCTVDERGQIAYAYKVSGQPSSKGQKVADELGKLGIKGIIYDLFESNYQGKTTTYKGGAVTVADAGVFINNLIERDPIETAGHEAFHYWWNIAERNDLVDIITDNINFSSREFIAFESEIEKDYFKKEVAIDDDSWDGLNEEIYAYIVGHVYSGDVYNEVRPFLRDYDEVKTATDSFFASQQNKDIRYSRELDLIDYVNEKTKAERANMTKAQLVAKVRSELESMKVGTGEIMAVQKVADKLFEQYGGEASISEFRYAMYEATRLALMEEGFDAAYEVINEIAKEVAYNPKDLGGEAEMKRVNDESFTLFILF